MARINLLPWRVERRQQRQREFFIMLSLAAVAGVLLSLLIWAYYNAQISGQQGRNAFLNEEIAKIEVQIEEIGRLDGQKKRLLDRKGVIEELQANRSQMVHLFDSLVRTMPDGVVLTSINQTGELLTLQGRSQSNARVSTYMRNLESSGWMTKPDLEIIEAEAQDPRADGAPRAASRELPYTFTLRVELVNPGTAKLEGELPADPAAAAESATEGVPVPQQAAPESQATPAPPSTEPQTPAQEPSGEQPRS